MSLAELERSGVLRRNVPMAPLTTYRFGGSADLYAEPSTMGELVALVGAAADTATEVVVIGRGSNMVVSDAGLRAMVLRLRGDFLAIVDDGDTVAAGAAVPLPRLARHTVEKDRGGLEFFVGIPGSVGGAVKMNAGCFGTDTASHMIQAQLLDVATGLERTATPEELEMTYRSTTVGSDDIVVSARFVTTAQDAEEGRRRLREITRWRRDHQPGGTLNAGSVFKNPPGDTAGRIIDELGLKGFRIGGAAVSPRHANFFEAGDDASPQDVHDLVAAVRLRVAEETGIHLEPEIAFFGDFDASGQGERR